MSTDGIRRAIVVLTHVHRWSRRTARVALFGAILAAGVAVGMLTSGPAFSWAMSHPAPVTPSGLCAVKAVPGHQDATVLVPGDAGNLWMPGAVTLHEYVCTDGTLVPVENYGIKPCKTEDSTNCSWNAAEQGNGQGISFTAYTVRIRYHLPKWAEVLPLPANVRHGERIKGPAFLLVTPGQTCIVTPRAIGHCS